MIGGPKYTTSETSLAKLADCNDWTKHHKPFERYVTLLVDRDERVF